MTKSKLPDDLRGQIIRKSLGLRDQVAGALQQQYHSRLVEWIRDHGELKIGDMRLRLAGEFGFCYGVDRAVEMAYETVERFPDRRIFITNEIIHNPTVNERLRLMGVRFLEKGEDGEVRVDCLGAEDVVIVPAFGARIDLQRRMQDLGCVLVDTTCGSVIRVWKRVEKLARDGFTSIIHGTYTHEETIATASRATDKGGHYIVVRDETEGREVCDYIEGRADRDAFIGKFKPACSNGFDPNEQLKRVGFANQTTMLASESLHIASLVRESMIKRYGEDHVDENFQSFDTICSATQDRQDAIIDMKDWAPDLIIVVGGFNSSNTGHLREIAATYAHAFHIDSAERLLSEREIEHKPDSRAELITNRDWLPGGPVKIGVTAGASTPNRVTGEVIERLLKFRNASPQELEAQLTAEQ